MRPVPLVLLEHEHGLALLYAEGGPSVVLLTTPSVPAGSLRSLLPSITEIAAIPLAAENRYGSAQALVLD
ncbi:hypothetical protein ACQEU5_24830 [Marinactinospora thermotolerans]|uniref:hypothetical protein n=1 Tax=Marinactinospora thermotolerans TaxID=531310 RepID=UPI003D940CF1